MGANSKIEWTHHTFNPWRGCSKVSAGCANCYAETMSHRNPAVLGVWGDEGTRVVAAESYWSLPLKWNREAQSAGERRRVFCASLADVFEDRAELVNPRRRLLDLIRRTTNLDWLLLTKRPENVRTMLCELEAATSIMGRIPFNVWLCDWLDGRPPANVWLGASVEDQATADERIPALLDCPAAVRFLSCEPLLGPVDLYRGGWSFLHPLRPPPGNKGGWKQGLDWLIVGGESGPKARPMHPQWARSIRDQCREAGVPFFFKQWGEWTPRIPDFGQLGRDDIIDTNGDDGAAPCYVMRVGKRIAGAVLDGRTHREVPGEAGA